MNLETTQRGDAEPQEDAGLDRIEVKTKFAYSASSALSIFSALKFSPT